jgi:D-alanine transaminase
MVRLFLSIMLVHLNGAVVPLAEARISPEDRGFLFADGVYEALLAWRGRLLLWHEHERRLRGGLEALRLPFADTGALAGAAEELLRANDLAGGWAAVYLQVTRGAAPRGHAFPVPPVTPTVYLSVRRHALLSADLAGSGVATVTVADTRWARCDVKSIGLLPNVLAQQRATEAGAHEAIFLRDGLAIEGSHSNLFVVRDGLLCTHPADHHILAGVTREAVLALARGAGVPVSDGIAPLAELAAVDEAFLTGTTTEVLPVVRIDGRPVGRGLPGPLTLRLRELYLRHLDALAGR